LIGRGGGGCRESCLLCGEDDRSFSDEATKMGAMSGRPETPIGIREVAHGGCATAHARSHPQIGELCNHRVAYSSIFLRLPRGAGSICGKFGAFLYTGVEW
jgi:hypothetical protein